MKQKQKAFLVRALLAICGALAGGFYVFLYFGGIFYLYFRAVTPAKERSMLVLLSALAALGIVLFFVLSHFVAKWIKAGRFAFPIGAFLVSDGALLSVFLLKLIDPKKMLALANNNTELAKSYIFGMMVMIAALTVQVVCWLISLLFAAFRYFQKVNFGGAPTSAPVSAAEKAAMEAELRAKIEAELRAGLMQKTAESQSKETEENEENA
ncbi:MAG: hypothetical protein J6V82_01595 [Clostridia bacterium]|nr:hypothetical protein [Clostridia bacterium]